MVDPDAILQVLGNFVSNARKYSPDGGTILISAREVGDQVVVDIRDHGLGFPADALPKLFGTFYRVDSDDQAPDQGHRPGPRNNSEDRRGPPRACGGRFRWPRQGFPLPFHAAVIPNQPSNCRCTHHRGRQWFRAPTQGTARSAKPHRFAGFRCRDCGTPAQGRHETSRICRRLDAARGAGRGIRIQTRG